MIELFMHYQLWIALTLLLLTVACTAHYTVHPGALNTADSAAYDTLLIAEAAIDEARTENQTRPLPADAQGALNVLIQSYNISREAWLTYRGAVATNTPSDQYFQQLIRNLTDLTNALRNFRTKGDQQ